MIKNKLTRKRGRPSDTTGADQATLLRSALGLFARNGYEGTNIKAISNEAEVAGSLLYYHYTNKEGVWKAALGLLAGELQSEMLASEKLFRDLDNLSFLKAWLRRFIYFSAQNPEFHMIVTYEMANPSARADWLLDEIIGPLHEKIKIKIDQLQEKGIIKKVPIANILSIVIGAANVFFIQGYQIKKLYGIDVYAINEVDQHADQVIEIIFNGLLEQDKE